MLTFDVTYASTEVAPAILPVLVTVTLYCTEPTENSSLIDILTGDSDNNSVLNTQMKTTSNNIKKLIHGYESSAVPFVVKRGVAESITKLVDWCACVETVCSTRRVSHVLTEERDLIYIVRWILE